MRVEQQHEFLCPYCAGVNIFYVGERNGLREELITCKHCSQIINVIAANGIDDAVNIVAFEHEEPLKSR